MQGTNIKQVYSCHANIFWISLLNYEFHLTVAFEKCTLTCSLKATGKYSITNTASVRDMNLSMSPLCQQTG